MAEIAHIVDSALREQLVDRQRTVEQEIGRVGRTPDLDGLLTEVQGALGRVANGTFGICETCHDPIETDRLIADPLVRFCLDHLSASEQRALERDLDLAARIQRGLLPTADVRMFGWDISYRYQPAGVVSGDYCDYVVTDSGDLYFMVGDVSGKGVAASMLMSHLHAAFHTLIPLNLPLGHMMKTASGLFCESALPAQYATLVCGRASRAGELEITNAGHPPPLLITRQGVTRIDATGLPIGMFHNENFDVTHLRLGPDDTLLMYTDGVVEAEDGEGHEYGTQRFAGVAVEALNLELPALVHACLTDLAGFRSGTTRSDDVTLVALRRNRFAEE